LEGEERDMGQEGASHRPGIREKIFFFGSGIIISVPLTLYLSSLSDYLCELTTVSLIYASICATAIFTPLIEEFAKAYPLFYRHGETERSIFTLGFLTGLGFGISEFFVYVFAQGVPIPIRLPGLFFHAASTSIVAYGIATRRPIRFYLIAVVLHFVNNFTALFGVVWLVGGLGAVLLAYLLAWQLYKRTSERLIEPCPPP
jgi:RsiW-degrading membrane proteinase PrsW (M82 family)